MSGPTKNKSTEVIHRSVPACGPGPRPPARRQHARRFQRAHLVGASGVGMSGLAQHLMARGWKISGSDARLGTNLEALEDQGAQFHHQHAVENLPVACDLLVHSSAISEDNPEVAEARQRGMEVLNFAQMLGRLIEGKNATAVAGTHGKTTTASILAFLLEKAGIDPSALIGGFVPQLGGNALCGPGSAFVLEACEYRENFLQLRPRHAIVTNVDADHLDHYGTLERVRQAFRQFVRRIEAEGCVITTADVAHDLDLRGATRARILAVGSKKSDIRIVGEGASAFRILHPDGERSPRLKFGFPGEAMRLDCAFAVIAARKIYGVPYDVIAEWIPRFEGIRRRFEVLLEKKDLVVVDDYAHHPTEIESALAAAREAYPRRRIVAVFQPHLASRTREHFPGFLNALALADVPIVLRDYRVTGRDRAPSHGARDLSEALRGLGVIESEYCDSPEICLRRLRSLRRRGDVILVMGAGDIEDLAHELARRLR